MSQKNQTAIQPTRLENFPEWYQQVIKAADLAETSVVRGCMVIKPRGYAIWENIQKVLDGMFKATGHVNAYFPLLIPLSFLEKEATHVEGFAKECAVVTHHKLESDGKGGLKPGGELDEPMIIRPTSETIIGHSYSKWVQSYRDLPILINQWANVFRWEMRTRLFLRTAEFLWQEGHTAHATAEEAREETFRMHQVYGDFVQNWLAIPLILGEKTAAERFPGAVDTYTIEAMMQDRKALQGGTSHFLGQNFAKASDIKFLDEKGQTQFAWTTSWGLTTRVIGAMIMVHGDDDGLIIPPAIAAEHIVVMPIYKTLEERTLVLEFADKLKKLLATQTFKNQPIVMKVDDRDIRGGEKNWQHVKNGTPIRIEIGPRDIAGGNLMVARRDESPKDKKLMPLEQFVQDLPNILTQMQKNLFDRAQAFRMANTQLIETTSQLEEFFAGSSDENAHVGGFALCHWSEEAADHEIMKRLKLTTRCYPLEGQFGYSPEPGRCIFTGKPSKQRVVIAKSY